ncbi:hypothetical protein E2C01_043165 [Portunus trituberculatus]|uniref:Uncharacterized protein n=1 Tax=Portunus trituberculatus TaxID=210409 RepID=A0A5B7FUY9_PORTR|nr:hypothetical protein [Portunus trituberculatus]
MYLHSIATTLTLLSHSPQSAQVHRSPHHRLQVWVVTGIMLVVVGWLLHFLSTKGDLPLLYPNQSRTPGPLSHYVAITGQALVAQSTGVFVVWSGETSVPIHMCVLAAVRVPPVLPLLALSVLPASWIVQAANTMRQTEPARVLHAAWWCLVLVMIHSYSGTLIASLTSPSIVKVSLSSFIFDALTSRGSRPGRE